MALRSMPEVVTHTFHPAAVFLSNICDLSRKEAESVLAHYREKGARLKTNYFTRRVETESWLIEERKRLLGETRRARPIYFFLGNFADGMDASRPCSLVMPFRAFPHEILTFTVPDSMASFPLASVERASDDRRPYHGKVFSTSEIEHIVEELGFPGNHWELQGTTKDRFIEMQVWTNGR